MPTKPDIPNLDITAYCGSGAYGDVWIGTDRDGIKRAVKVLDIERLESLGALTREEKAVKLFRTQVQRHPNLIEIFYAGGTDQHIYHIMELADNSAEESGTYIPDTLSERLKGGRSIPFDECMSILSQILDAVEHLHNNSLLHRDIKPSNILFVNGVAKLADIGLISSSNAEVSQVGTLGFIPPDGETGPSSDLYALGKLLYCMYTGKPAEEFPSLPDCDPYTASMEQLKTVNRTILKACDKVPQKRFKSVSEFRKSLTEKKVCGRSKKRLLFSRILSTCLLLLCTNYWYRQYQEHKESEKQHAIELAQKEQAEQLRLMKELTLAIDNHTPASARQVATTIKEKWPQWAAANYSFCKSEEKLQGLEELATAVGGEQNLELFSKIVTLNATNPNAALQQLKELWKESNNRTIPLIISTYAHALEVHGDHKKAEEIFLYLDHPATLQDKRSLPGSYKARAEFYIRQKQYTKALSDMDKAIQLSPDRFTYYLQRSWIKIKLGDLIGGKEDAEKALELKPDNPTAKRMINAISDTSKTDM